MPRSDRNATLCKCKAICYNKPTEIGGAPVSNEINRKSLPLELKREPDENGEFEGYASVFGAVDNGMDVVDRGAFTKSLGERTPKMLWQHDVEQPIGVWDEVKEDERGLFVKGRILKDVAKGAEAMALMRAGAIDSMSIGYQAKTATREGGGSIRRLHEVDLYEISLVTIPMLESATITDFKSLDWGNKRDVEAALRDVLGLSQAEAKAFIAGGYGDLAAKRDVDAGEESSEEDLTGLESILKTLQETVNV